MIRRAEGCQLHNLATSIPASQMRTIYLIFLMAKRGSLVFTNLLFFVLTPLALSVSKKKKKLPSLQTKHTNIQLFTNLYSIALCVTDNPHNHFTKYVFWPPTLEYMLNSCLNIHRCRFQKKKEIFLFFRIYFAHWSFCRMRKKNNHEQKLYYWAQNDKA